MIEEVEEEYSTVGTHIVVDCWGVNKHILNDLNFFLTTGTIAIEKSGATIVGEPQTKQFEPQGVTVLFLLQESHLSFHTYPERGFVAIDCYTCGYTVDPDIAIEIILKALSPKLINKKVLIRGTGNITIV